MKPTDPAAILFLLRFLHLVAAAVWLGLVLFVDRVAAAFLADAGDFSFGAAGLSLLPRVRLWYGAGAVATLATGFADYVLVLAEENIAPRALVWLGAWTVAATVTMAIEKAASLSPLRSFRRNALSAAVVVWLAAVAMSGDWYMRRGGSHKAIAVSLGGGLAFVMFANTALVFGRDALALLDPERRRVAAYAARTNFYLAIAVLFFMGAASHLPIFGAATARVR